MTQKEIKSRFGSTVFIERGGFNCRHQWIAVEASDDSKDVRTDAG